MSHVSITVFLFKTATLVLGGIITYLAGKAYHRTEETGLRWLAIGFGIVTLGTLLAGLVDQVFIINRGAARMIESGLTTIGFAVIVYSLIKTQSHSVSLDK